MRAAGRGRVVMISSVLGLVAAPWRGAYVATKFALEGITDSLRLELAGSGIHVVLIEPGPIRTAFRRNSIPHFERHIDWRASPHRAAYEQASCSGSTRRRPTRPLRAAALGGDRAADPRAGEPAPAAALLRDHADPRRRPAAPAPLHAHARRDRARGTARRQAPVTRQMTSPTSSATRSEPSGPMVTPTGRP